MIKICNHTITVPLVIIFKKAIATGVFPDIWKKGNIVPIHKKESKNEIKKLSSYQSFTHFW